MNIRMILFRVCRRILFFYFALPLCVSVPLLTAQQQTVTPVDSLKRRIASAEDTNRVVGLNAVARYYWNTVNDQDSALAYSRQAEELALRLDFKLGWINAVRLRGNAHYRKSNYPKALADYRRALEMAERVGTQNEQGKLLNNIANVYSDLGNQSGALELYLKALAIREAIQDREGMTVSLHNIAFLYEQQGKTTEAMDYYQKELQLCRTLDDSEGTAIVLNHIGGLLGKQTKHSEALDCYRRAIALFATLGHRYGQAMTLNNMGDTYRSLRHNDSARVCLEQALAIKEELGNVQSIVVSLLALSHLDLSENHSDRALATARRALALSHSIGKSERLQEVYKTTSEIFQTMGQSDSALVYHQRYTTLKDSLFSLANTRTITEIKTLYETEKKDQEIRLLHADREKQALVQNSLLGGTILLIGAALILANLYRVKRRSEQEIRRQNLLLEQQSNDIARTNAALQEAHQRSEELLCNILPELIAERMKAGETTIAEHFSDVTVLFADLVGFTRFAAVMKPVQIVELLDSLFSTFDALAQHHGVEKIKTVGDAYLAVCGVPKAVEHHTERIAAFALDICKAVHNFQQEILPSEKGGLQVRIGIHSGEVVAGVIGKKKFSYDLWGDTVNTASRMESHGESGRIHVTEEVYNVLQDKFVFEERGEIEVKGKGLMRTWFLTGSRKS